MPRPCSRETIPLVASCASAFWTVPTLTPRRLASCSSDGSRSPPRSDPDSMPPTIDSHMPSTLVIGAGRCGRWSARTGDRGLADVERSLEVRDLDRVANSRSPSAATFSPASRMEEASKSTFSGIVRSVLTLPLTLTVGETMFPIGLPTPVPKKISWQPAAANAVRFSTAGAGASMKCSPGEAGACP